MSEYTPASAWKFLRKRWNDPRLSEMVIYAASKARCADTLKDKEDWEDISQAASNRYRELLGLEPYPMPWRKSWTNVVVPWPREEPPVTPEPAATE